MGFDEMIERIFNCIGDLSPSEVNDIIDEIFIKEEIETPFGIITTYRRRLLIERIKENRT